MAEKIKALRYLGTLSDCSKRLHADVQHRVLRHEEPRRQRGLHRGCPRRLANQVWQRYQRRLRCPIKKKAPPFLFHETSSTLPSPSSRLSQHTPKVLPILRNHPASILSSSGRSKTFKSSHRADLTPSRSSVTSCRQEASSHPAFHITRYSSKAQDCRHVETYLYDMHWASTDELLVLGHPLPCLCGPFLSTLSSGT